MSFTTVLPLRYPSPTGEGFFASFPSQVNLYADYRVVFVIQKSRHNRVCFFYFSFLRKYTYSIGYEREDAAYKTHNAEHEAEYGILLKEAEIATRDE